MLVDSEVIAIEIEVAALNAVGVPLTPQGMAERFVGVSNATVRTAVAQEFGVHLDDGFWEEVRREGMAALADRVTAIPGIAALIRQLDVPHCLASSSRHDRIELSLRTAGLLDLFPRRIRFSSQDVVCGKPSPDLFMHAADVMGVQPSRCLVVEDSPHGVRAALAAGMDVVGFTGGGHADLAWEERLRAAGAPRTVSDAVSLRPLLR